MRVTGLIILLILISVINGTKKYYPEIKKAPATPKPTPKPSDDPCSKKCSKLTKGLPCIHDGFDDDTCYEFLKYGKCPQGSTQCGTVKEPCKLCDYYRPCLKDDGILGYGCYPVNKDGACDYKYSLCPFKKPDPPTLKPTKKVTLKPTSKPIAKKAPPTPKPTKKLTPKPTLRPTLKPIKVVKKAPKPTEGKKPTSRPTLKPTIDPCLKKCSKLTKGLPCIHNNIDDDTCYPFTKYGKCPPATTKCFEFIPKKDVKPVIPLPKPTPKPTPKKPTTKPTKRPTIDPCSKKCSKLTKGLPCIHNGVDDDTCYPFTKYGKCPPDTTECFPFTKKVYPTPKKPETPKEPKKVPPTLKPTLKPIAKKAPPTPKPTKKITPKPTLKPVKKVVPKKPEPPKEAKKITPTPKPTVKPTKDICKVKKCSKKTFGKPCVPIYDFDDCVDFRPLGGCPAGFKDCSGTKDPCEYCSAKKPCLQETFKDFYNCLETIDGKCAIGSGSILCPFPDAKKYYPKKPQPPTKKAPPTPKPTKKITPKPTSKPIAKKAPPTPKPVADPKKYGGHVDPCAKTCNSRSTGTACKTLKPDDDTCFDYNYETGKCPSGTQDCGIGSIIENPCHYCDKYYPCLYDDKGTYYCEKLDYTFKTDGECYHGAVLCPGLISVGPDDGKTIEDKTRGDPFTDLDLTLEG